MVFPSLSHPYLIHPYQIRYWSSVPRAYIRIHLVG
jgi:hypothetical protein